MQESFTVAINAVIYQDGDDWIAQGIEHDICAQGRSIQEARRAFEESVVGMALFGVASGKRPLSDIPPAPEEFHAMFEKAEVSIDSATKDSWAALSMLPREAAPKVKPVFRLFERSQESFPAFAY